MKKGHRAKAQREKKKPFSGTGATSNTSIGRKDEREKRKGVGKTGWFFCFKLRFHISYFYRKELPVEERIRRWEMGVMEGHRDTQRGHD